MISIACFAARALALPIAKDPVFVHGWAAMEGGRAVMRSDPPRARELLVDARRVFTVIKNDSRVAECDGLIAKLPR